MIGVESVGGLGLREMRKGLGQSVWISGRDVGGDADLR